MLLFRALENDGGGHYLVCELTVKGGAKASNCTPNTVYNSKADTSNCYVTNH